MIAFISSVSLSANGCTIGLISSANSAMMWASILSVLASFPLALAKSLTRFGLTIANCKPASVMYPANNFSNPPVASAIVNSGDLIFK